MAKLQKKIQHNAQKIKSEMDKPKRVKKNYGKDYWLIIMILINLALILMSTPLIEEQPVSFAASIFLEVLLVNMYLLRHYDFGEKTEMWMTRLQYGGMLVLVVLFSISLYQRYA